ncbi:MAG: TolC family protein [Planctomycetota bacterium]
MRVEDARTEQALNRYEQTVLKALEDVENAVVSYIQEDTRRGALERSVTAARKSTELVKTLYVNGLTDFQNVQEMERFQFVQEDRYAESEGKVTQNLIRIYRSLGGGWDSEITKKNIN